METIQRDSDDNNLPSRASPTPTNQLSLLLFSIIFFFLPPSLSLSSHFYYFSFSFLSLSLSRTIQCNHCPSVESVSPIQKERNTRQLNASRFPPFPNIFFSFIKRSFHTVSTTDRQTVHLPLSRRFHGEEGGPKKAMDSRGTRSHNARQHLQM